MDLGQILAKHKIDEYVDGEFPSCVILEQDHALICLRQFSVAQDDIEGSSRFIVTSEGKTVSFDVKAGKITNQLEIASAYESIEAVLGNNRNVLDVIVDESEALEDKIFERKLPKNSIDLWFEFRSAATKLRRSFERVQLILKRMNSSDVFACDQEGMVARIQEANDFAIRECVSCLHKLESLHSYIASVKADKLNANIYLLALVSGVFLPLNLLVGFFGMNTKGMFFDGNDDGTYMVAQILLGLFLFLILGLPLLRILDSIIFRKIFAHSQLYNRLSKRIEDLNESFTLSRRE